MSQRIRKRVEEIFGWDKTVAGGRKLRYKGVKRNGLWWELTATAYDLRMIAKIALAQAARGEVCPAGQKRLENRSKRLKGGTDKPIIIKKSSEKGVNQRLMVKNWTAASITVFHHSS